jgi:hypothetical protein
MRLSGAAIIFIAAITSHALCAAIHLNIYLAPLIDCRKKRRRRVKGVMHMCENNKRPSSTSRRQRRRRRSCIALCILLGSLLPRAYSESGIRGAGNDTNFECRPQIFIFGPSGDSTGGDALRGFLEISESLAASVYANSAQLLMNKAKVDNPGPK